MSDEGLIIQDYIIDFIRILIICVLTIITNLKILNLKDIIKKNLLKLIILIFLINNFCIYIQNIINPAISIISLNFLLSLLFSNITGNKIGYSILITTLSLSINYVIYTISTIVCFIIFKAMDGNNKSIIISTITLIDIIIMLALYKIKRFSKGITFLKKNKNNEYFEILILNVEMTFLLAFVIFTNANIESMKPIFVYIVIFSILMVITIQKLLQLYYKQELLRRNTEEKEKELKNKNKELQEKDKKIEKLEKENLELNKKIHSINYRQDSLTYKLNTLSQKSEIAEEIDIRDRINKISKVIEEEKIAIELTKTNIEIIDDMLRYMQSECIKNNIDFELKINGNIKHMAKNIVSKEDLEILIATLIKNAIIAINYSDNINKSILVRLGIIDGIYSLYVYDTGIEFKIETLLNLGIKPSTTHADNGGTGMGFMNTFDTLNKYKASIIIKEYGEESKDNYTKAIIIKFDKNNNYKINSYRSDKIKEKDPKNIIVEKL